jgi:CRP-like cAMP-binding protein
MVTKEELEKIPLFSEFSDAEREVVASVVEKKELLPDTLIFGETDPGGKLYIVYKGEVKITRVIREREQQVLNKLQDGEFFGGVSFIDGSDHSASAVCTTDSVIFTIKKSDFDKLTEKDPILGIRILKHLIFSICSYLRKMNEKFYDMVQYVSLTR